MKINKHNYQAWFLDYTEGNLSVEDKYELFLFLEQNPELKRELEEFETITLPVNITFFEGKEQLKKPVYADDILIAYLENDLGRKEKTELEKAIAQHVYLKREIDLYKKTISIPDAVIVYEHKEKLKKGGLVLIWNIPVNYFRAAAVLLFMGLIFLIIKWLDKEPESVLAKNKEVTYSKRGVVSNNVNQAFVTNPQNNLIAVKEEQMAVTKKKNNYTNKQDSLYKVINTNKAIPIENDSLKNNNAQGNNLVQNNNKQDTLNNQLFVADQEENNQSYFNHASDLDENNTPVLQVKANPTQTKKPFFRFLSFAAKGAKQLGAKHIDVKESVSEDVITMGGIALSETTSN